MSARTQPIVRAGVERGSLHWYWNRLRVMGPAELIHRTTSAVGKLSLKNRSRVLSWTPAPDLTVRSPGPWLAAATDMRGLAFDRAVVLADQLLAGRWLRLDGRIVDIGMPPAWAELEHRDASDDVRHLMELHRHTHLVPLAQAFAATGEARYRDAVVAHLDSWFEQCRYPSGTAWASALDASLRLANWSMVWQLIGASATDSSAMPEPTHRRWLDEVILHAHVIRHNLSRHSSANNHLLGELFGLVVADATWPHWARLREWADKAHGVLQVEALRQNAPDGSNREQASWYQAFVFELLAVAMHIARIRGLPVSDSVAERLAAMARFAAALRNVNGDVSHHGDADGATALGLVIDHDDAFERMLDLAVCLGIAPELSPLLTRAPSLGPWIVGKQTADIATAAAGTTDRFIARRQLPRAFDVGGHYQLGSDFGAATEIMMSLDGGPIGYLSIAAHGHSDALSMRLSVAGRELLVDRGTGSYNVEPTWRRYFRGTLAHNTVCLDRADQSVHGGAFLWLAKARAVVEQFQSNDEHGLFEASHDGYRRLAGRPSHARSVRWLGSERRFTVTDVVTGKGTRSIAIAWHFAPGSTVTIGHGNQVTASVGEATVHLQVESDASGCLALHCGDPSSFLGWHSPRLGVRVAAPSLVWRATVIDTARITTTLQIEIPTPGGDDHATKSSRMRGGQLHDGGDA